MGSRGPMPKPDATRRRRNAPTASRTAVPASGRKGRRPHPSRKLDAAAMVYWRRYWKLPVAELWTEADIPAITRLCYLQARSYEEGGERLLNEIRQLEDRFALNLQARERLGIYEVDDVPEASPTPAPSSSASSSTSRFGELRAVE